MRYVGVSICEENLVFFSFFFNDTATTEIYTLSLHDALPIGAILSPQLFGFERSGTLPWASSLCGACYEVCPVKIDIPSVLVHLRGKVVHERKTVLDPEAAAMKAAAWAFSTRARFERAQRLGRLGQWPLARG